MKNDWGEYRIQEKRVTGKKGEGGKKEGGWNEKRRWMERAKEDGGNKDTR